MHRPMYLLPATYLALMVALTGIGFAGLAAIGIDAQLGPIPAIMMLIGSSSGIPLLLQAPFSR